MKKQLGMKYALFLLVISACSPKVVTNFINQSYPMVNTYESFGIIESDKINFDQENYLGQIEIKDNFLSINCDYWTIIEKLKTEARKIGGNLIRIDEHKKPSTYGSSCHQIMASIFRIKNPRPFEERIYWDQKRKLTIEDFKGSIENRPFQASTFSGIEYYIKPKSSGFDITVRTQFDCFKSYFKPSESDSLVLEHEQLHFNITEIYARHFFKKLLETELNPFDFNNQVNKLLSEITIELSLKQDEYDSEVYQNSKMQTQWNLWVKTELEKLKEYELKEKK